MEEGIKDIVANVGGTITEIIYRGMVILNMLLQRLILSIPLDVLEKVTPIINNSSIFGITCMVFNKHKEYRPTIFTYKVVFDC